ncbi:TAT-variant-translocated molybdopterin oxidoreductase [candidate division KSB1 bacterium]|nr:TAT-variant-translocated molybdopterin oxidoreductase [bacterium]NUM63819.1 TAT-variant-translocated molybdopterin oxidoreductase [candidate division KSB1 bacterium]
MSTMTDTPHLDLEEIRRRLNGKQGKQYWRCLEELAETPAFQQFVENEFAPGVVDYSSAVNRRNFLKFMGASLALAGLNACTRQPVEKIFPYVQPPEQIVPGKPVYFATAMLQRGFAQGLLAESHMGRPTKVEGNPEHPASLGATDIFAQASVLTLYDPDRAQVVTRTGRVSTWEAFLSEFNLKLEALRQKQGAGLRVLTETVTSPTLADQLQRMRAAFPAAKWHQYEPTSRDHARAGATLAFGEVVETHYRFDRAAVVLALDADFLIDHPNSVRYAREFSSQRRVVDGEQKMNRLYMIESTPTLTGSMADHRWALPPAALENIVRAVAAECGIGSTPAALDSGQEKWIKAIADDLKSHRGAGIVIVGDSQPPVVHLLAHALNHALGNAGNTVVYTAPVEAEPVDQMASLRELVNDMNAGAVEVLVMMGGNPVFTAPADLDFAGALAKVGLRVQLSLHDDETAALCHWHIPESHYLESWSDGRAFDGSVTIIQPLIAPLYNSKSAHEMLAVMLGQSGSSGYDSVREYWQKQHNTPDFETFWQVSVHDGVVANTALPLKSVTFTGQLPPPTGTAAGASLAICFRPDPSVGDGRFANNGWLQELPKPLTKLTWDNAALLSPATAQRLKLQNEEVVELQYQGRTVNAPVWIMPGHPEATVTVHFGYGRSRGGQLASGTGFNAYALRTSAAPWFGHGLEIRKTGERHRLATSQMHHSMENRHLVRTGTLAEFVAHPEFIHEMGHEPAPEMTLYPEHKYEDNAWGMVIDLNACLGCNACTIACQSENNIAVVGKEQVLIGREMHWIRVDRYYEGDLDHPDTYHQPVPCMHCEKAPCEPVCPVGATVHSSEGLNDMVYNRCVGTRYCANNCPYKVRRFNFLLYSDFETPIVKLQRNPDVTVRSRGVMEKCTYCVQRINAARIEAKKEERAIADGEILTACQQVCPAQAIIFGNLNDPNSRVAKLKESPLNYGLLTDLNTRPRTTYLARLRNPNPALAEESSHA